MRFRSIVLAVLAGGSAPAAQGGMPRLRGSGGDAPVLALGDGAHPGGFDQVRASAVPVASSFLLLFVCSALNTSLAGRAASSAIHRAFKKPVSVSATDNRHCIILEVSIEYDNGHPGEGTIDALCVEPAWRGRPCGVPDDKNGYTVTDGHSRFCPGDWVTLEIEGGDALLIDQVKVEWFEYDNSVHEWEGVHWGTIGADNGVGLCLSEDADDHYGFGHQAYDDKCCASIRINPYALEWEWGC